MRHTKENSFLWIPRMERPCLSLNPQVIYSIMVCWIIDCTPYWCTYSHQIDSLWDSSGIPLLPVLFRAVQRYYCTSTALRTFRTFYIPSIFTLCQLNKTDEVLLISLTIFCCCLFLVSSILHKAKGACWQTNQQSHFSITHLWLSKTVIKSRFVFCQ